MNTTDVPEPYRQYFFVNPDGPSRKIMRRDMIEKNWQMVTLDCSHRILLTNYRKAMSVGCGFCAGFDPLQTQTNAAIPS